MHIYTYLLHRFALTVLLRVRMSLPATVQVLIVGAGPIGLATAISLSKLGVEFVIVDASTRSQHGSRAAAIHAHTFEVVYP